MSNDPWGIQMRVYTPEEEDALWIRIFRRLPSPKGGAMHLEDGVWKYYKNGQRWGEPTFKIPGMEAKSVLQQLANQLRSMGIIPESTRSEVTDLEKTLGAKDEHITDLRKVLDMVVSSDKVRLLSND